MDLLRLDAGLVVLGRGASIVVILCFAKLMNYD